MKIKEEITDNKNEENLDSVTMLKKHSSDFLDFTKKQSFSYFIGGAILCYRKVFRFLNIDNPSSSINNINDINNFVSCHSRFLSKRSDFFKDLILKIIFSEEFEDYNLKNFKQIIVVHMFNFFSEHLSFVKTEKLSVAIIEGFDDYDKEDFQSFYLKNFSYPYRFYNVNKNFIEIKMLALYVIDRFVSEFLSKIDDISDIVEEVSILNRSARLINQFEKKEPNGYEQYGLKKTKKHLSSISKDCKIEFNKKINFYYKKYFGDQINNMFKARQYFCYLDIGEETIKVMSYLKKSNININTEIEYNLMIENNFDAYLQIKKEYPNLFYFSYSLIGFKGYDQIKILKSLLRKPIENKISEMGNAFIYADSLSKLSFPLSNKGWKYLLSQNKNYILRASRNFKQSLLCCNLELKDAWLRSPTLHKIINSEVYFSAHNLIIKSILNHKGPVSKFTGFNNVFIYDDSIKPKKVHLNTILDSIKDVAKKIKSNNIKTTDLEMLNMLFLLFSYSYYEIIDIKSEISEKYQNIYNAICNFCIENTDQVKESDENDENEISLNRTKNIQVVFCENNLLSSCQKLKPFVAEFEGFLNYAIKYYYRNKSEIFNKFMVKYYAMTSGNSYCGDFEGFDDSPYISLKHALQKIKDFINFHYIQKLTNEQLKDAGKFNINRLLYVDKKFMKNIKDLDHLFDSSEKWHKKEQEEKLAKINNISFDIDFISNHPDFDKKQGCFLFKGFNFYPIKNSIEMYHEKLKMKHCIYSYTSDCANKKYLAFRVEPVISNIFDKKKSMLRATLGCRRYANNNLDFDQTYSFCDSAVSNSQAIISEEFVDMLNKNAKD